GWFPMLAAGGVFAVMSTWRFGASWRARELAKMRMPFDDLFATLKLDPPGRVKGTAVFMTQDPEGTPPALLHQLKHNQVLHEQVVILTIVTTAVPTVPPAERVEITQLGRGFWRVVARYGFMETPRVPDGGQRAQHQLRVAQQLLGRVEHVEDAQQPPEHDRVDAHRGHEGAVDEPAEGLLGDAGEPAARVRECERLALAEPAAVAGDGGLPERAQLGLASATTRLPEMLAGSARSALVRRGRAAHGRRPARRP